MEGTSSILNVFLFCFENIPLSANFTKWSKHTQTIRREIADELFVCVWPFCEIGAKRDINALQWHLETWEIICQTVDLQNIGY